MRPLFLQRPNRIGGICSATVSGNHETCAPAAKIYSLVNTATLSYPHPVRPTLSQIGVGLSQDHRPPPSQPDGPATKHCFYSLINRSRCERLADLICHFNCEEVHLGRPCPRKYFHFVLIEQSAALAPGRCGQRALGANASR